MTERVRVLVVDDDPISLEVVRDRLERAGYVPYARESATGTVEWIASNLPDIVLLDVMMPDLDGPALAAELDRRGLAKRVGIVLHSSKTVHELFAMVRSSAAIGAIRKTTDEGRFIAELDHLVRTHRNRAVRE